MGTEVKAPTNDIDIAIDKSYELTVEVMTLESAKLIIAEDTNYLELKAALDTALEIGLLTSVCSSLSYYQEIAIAVDSISLPTDMFVSIGEIEEWPIPVNFSKAKDELIRYYSGKTLIGTQRAA